MRFILGLPVKTGIIFVTYKMPPNRNKMNPVSLYVNACRCAMQAKAEDPESWTELHRLLPLARQALSCCVCTKLLREPMGPTTTVCHHHVCKACIGGKMRIRPSCGWCNDFNLFVDKPVLKVVVQCFRQLCVYLASSPISSHFSGTANGGANNILAVIQNVLTTECDQSTGSSPMLFNNLLPGGFHSPGRQSDNEVNSDQSQVRSEVTAHKVDANTQTLHQETDSEPPTLELETDLLSSSASCSGFNYITGNSDLDISDKTNSRYEEDEVELVQIECGDMSRKADGTESENNRHSFDSDVNVKRVLAAEHDYHKDNASVYSVTLMNDINPKLKICRTPPSDVPESNGSPVNNNITAKKSKSSEKTASRKRNSEVKGKNSKAPKIDKQELDTKSKQLKREKGTGCRCGTATANPGKLTCCGQRCPCYSAYKGCTDCRCRGCRNPRTDGMTPPPHILLQQQSILQMQVSKIHPDEEEDVEIDV